MSKPHITCHVLDSSLGRPAAGVRVEVQIQENPDADVDAFSKIGSGVTNSDGRCLELLDQAYMLVADQQYKVIFKTKEYFERTDRKCFYPWVEITFTVENPSEHFHIPLIISPFSYTTYRGS